MTVRKYVVIGSMVLLLSVSMLMMGTGLAQEARIIRIYGDFTTGKPAVTRVEPQETWIAKGTTVVWHNLSKKEIKILFPKGKECQEATGARVLWKLDPRACLITDFNIPFGGTTSALFNSIGRYDYEIEYAGEKTKEKGSILVRTEPYGK
jgi:hypothetical protein